MSFSTRTLVARRTQRFKQNKPAGAWGAEYTLAQLLRAKGAELRIVVLPPKIDGTKYGIDDLVAERGQHEVLKLIYNNWVTERGSTDHPPDGEARLPARRPEESMGICFLCRPIWPDQHPQPTVKRPPTEKQLAARARIQFKPKSTEQVSEPPDQKSPGDGLTEG
jgi:hypothetical protein